MMKMFLDDRTKDTRTGRCKDVGRKVFTFVHWMSFIIET